ncbi:MAG: sugar transferase [Pseudomonadota bacterium]
MSVVEEATAKSGLVANSLGLSAERCRHSRAKRVIDIAGAGIGLVLLSPLLLFLALATKGQDAGPVFFRQRRSGLNGQEFLIWKFRTMRHDPAQTEFHQTNGRDDPRVTRLGRWMRSNNLDELPQLLNVITGDMSLVGPRPHPVALDRELEPLADHYRLRHLVKPGITGLAQISGHRGAVKSAQALEQRLTSDLHYIRNWSLMKDFAIIIKTVASRPAFDNAY